MYNDYTKGLAREYIDAVRQMDAGKLSDERFWELSDRRVSIYESLLLELNETRESLKDMRTKALSILREV